MKHISFLLLTKHLLFYVFSVSYAQEAIGQSLYDVNIRSKKGKILRNKVTLPSVLENRFFKVVVNQGSEALNLLDELLDEKTKLRAATVFYHMNLSKSYFDNHTSLPRLERQIVLRVNQVQGYDPVNHFMDEGEDLIALLAASSIKANPYPAVGTEPWGPETFFFKPRKIKMKSQFERAGKALDSPSIKNSLRFNLLKQNGIEIAADYLIKGGFSKFDYQLHRNSVLISFLIPELFPKFLRLIGLFTKTTVELDIAMLPEVIAHEYTHHRLHHIFNTSGSALDEGYANFFAHKYSDLDVIGGQARKYLKGSRGKKINKKLTYSYSEELRSQKHLSGEFVYTVLGLVEKELDIIEDSLGFKIVEQSLHESYFGQPCLNQRSNINKGLTSCLLLATKTVLKDNADLQRLALEKIYGVFMRIGI